ncbi:unnamed protein product [Microthlaspi erraticum]|uniref:Uncharacterized protein n=1 Tax=Microthlaspi erraticum TaxID=1685480 RepID=A0A6D2IS58_9BRAS|nr:unnamed protein product [Microthlaspi erraticum]
MAKFSTLLMIALLLCSTLMCTARPDQTFSASITIVPADPCNLEKKIDGKVDDVSEENCGADDEDCLMRSFVTEDELEGTYTVSLTEKDFKTTEVEEVDGNEVEVDEALENLNVVMATMMKDYGPPVVAAPTPTSVEVSVPAGQAQQRGWNLRLATA